MAIVPIALTDSSPLPTAWETPPDPVALRSPIPRGLIRFDSSGAVAAKGAGDVTNLTIQITMPPGFAYLPRNVVVRFRSVDLVELFNANAQGFYVFNSDGGRFLPFNCTSPGQWVENGAVAGKIWVPGAGAPKLLMRDTDTITISMADMDAGASSAGSLAWIMEFYVFDVNQVDKWEVNTPIPIIDHASF